MDGDKEQQHDATGTVKREGTNSFGIFHDVDCPGKKERSISKYLLYDTLAHISN